MFDGDPEILSPVPPTSHTSLSGWHVDSDDLAVGGQRQLSGDDFASHCHWARRELEGLPGRGRTGSHRGHRAGGGWENMWFKKQLCK